MRKELRFWSFFNSTFYAQCFFDAAVGAMNTPKAVSSLCHRQVFSCCFYICFLGGGGGGDDDYPSLNTVVSSLEHQFNFDIIMLIDRIQERITLKAVMHTLSVFRRQSGLLVTVSQCL